LRTTLTILLTCAVLGAGVFWFLTRPAGLPADFAAGLTPNVKAGALVFAAGGCASCHAAPKAEGDAKLVLAGGLAFPSDFGTFYAPNISPDSQHGIGSWSVNQFARAVTQGVSPEGAHYYPAFPYTAYLHMAAQDLIDLHAYMRQLPPSSTPSKPHDVGFPFNIRRGLGLWKALYVDEAYVISDALPEDATRGRYLVEGLAHCAECHTPRDRFGGLDRDRWLAGTPNPSGKGQIPNITPAKLDWSAADIAYYLSSGFTPDFDSAGGEMAEVVSNLAQLPDSDRAAIAAYLKAVPEVE